MLVIRVLRATKIETIQSMNTPFNAVGTTLSSDVASLDSVHRKGDRLFAALLPLQYVALVVLAIWPMI